MRRQRRRYRPLSLFPTSRSRSLSLDGEGGVVDRPGQGAPRGTGKTGHGTRDVRGRAGCRLQDTMRGGHVDSAVIKGCGDVMRGRAWAPEWIRQAVIATTAPSRINCPRAVSAPAPPPPCRARRAGGAAPAHALAPTDAPPPLPRTTPKTVTSLSRPPANELIRILLSRPSRVPGPHYPPPPAPRWRRRRRISRSRGRRRRRRTRAGTRHATSGSGCRRTVGVCVR